MNLDVESVKQVFSTEGAALGMLQQVADLLPKGSRKDEALESLERAERALKMAESQMATSMEYELCRKHFPPVVMLSSDDTNWECPECGNKKYTGLTMGTISLNFAEHGERRV